MSAVWNTFVSGLQGEFVKPVDIALPAQRYDMGRPVGKVVVEVEGGEEVAATKGKVVVEVEGGEEVAATKGKVAATCKGTKAEVVRELIASAKAEHRGVDTVVAEVIALLGMAKTLATTYVKNNWSKV